MAKKKNKTTQTSTTTIGDRAQVGITMGPVHNTGNMVVHPPPAVPATQTYEVSDVRPTPITNGVVTATSWLTRLTGLVAAGVGLYETFSPLLESLGSGPLLLAGRAELDVLWLPLFAAGILIASFGFSFRRWADFLDRETYKLPKRPGNKAWAGLRDEKGKLRLHRVRLDGKCIHCDGLLRFYRRPDQDASAHSQEGDATKRSVVRRTPVMECKRSDEHRTPFEITDTKRLRAVT